MSALAPVVEPNAALQPDGMPEPVQTAHRLFKMGT
jgi:hypothetical protein